MFDLAPSPDLPRFALSPYDEIFIDGVPHRTTEPSARGHLFIPLRDQPTGGAPVAFELAHEDIARRITANRMTVECDAFLPEEAKRRLRGSSELFCTLDEAVQERARFRHALVEAAQDMHAEGLLVWTDASITAAMPEIERRAREIFNSARERKRRYAGASTAPSMEVSAKSVRSWKKAYERDGLMGLVDQRSRSGRRAAWMHPDERSLMMAVVRGYASPQQPSKQQIVTDVRKAFVKENKTRTAQGLPKLLLPKRHVITAAIENLDPFLVAVARDGLESARRRFAPVGEGLDLTRPLQRVEIDEWKVDLITLLADAGLYTDELKAELAQLKLDTKKTRFWLTVAICATTRAIVAMKLSLKPSAASAMQTIDMMLRDKGVFTDAVGALAPWDMYGTPDFVVADSGPAFKSVELRGAMSDLGVRFENAPVRKPHLRGRGDRMFGTLGGKLMPRLTGRTFSSLALRGDHDPGANAALSVEELCSALVRWVVDIYHITPHAGLGDETPFNAWRRLTKLYGVKPAPDLRRRRLVFGTKLTRKADREGVVIHGVRYHSERLARWFVAHNKGDVDVRWYSEDIGVVMVRVGKEWIEVPSVQRRFAGVSALVWRMAARQLRATRAAEAEMSEDVVFRAIDDIEAMNAAAMKREGLVVHDWSPEALKRLEESLFAGFRIRANDAPARPADAAPRGLGRALPTAAAAMTPPTAEAPSPKAALAISAPPATTPCPAHPQPTTPDRAPDADEDLGFEEK
jgi:putative transposase